MALTRKQAKQLSQAHTGYNNEQFRTAYMNAKNAVHESAGLTGKNKREAARNIVAGITAPEHEAIAVPKASFVYTPEITPLKRMEGYTETGPLTVVNVEPEAAPAVNRAVEAPRVLGGTPVTQDPAYLAKRAKTDAWYQFQHEVDAYNRAHNNYRPTQDSHAYQAWLEEEFNRIYPNMVNGVRNSSSVYHEPTVQDLTRLQNAKLNYGALPFSNSEKEMYGVDLNGDMFGLRDGSGVAGGGYASGKGISAGAKEKANNQFNAALGTMLFGPALADIITLEAAGEGANSSSGSAIPQTNAYYQGYPRVVSQGRAASTTGKAGRTYYQTVGNAANADAHTAAGFGRAVDVQPGSFTGLIDNAGNTARTAAELYRPGAIVDETVKLPRFIRAIGSLARGFEKGGIIKRTK